MFPPSSFVLCWFLFLFCFLDAAWTDDIQVMLMVCQKANFDYKSKAAIDVVAQENQ